MEVRFFFLFLFREQNFLRNKFLNNLQKRAFMAAAAQDSIGGNNANKCSESLAWCAPLV